MDYLDAITLGSVMAEITPVAAGETLTGANSLVLATAGSAANFAQAFAALGGRLGLVSRVGDDDLGRWMREELAGTGIEVSQVGAVAGQFSPLSLGSVDREGNKTFAHYRFPGYSDPLATFRHRSVPDDFLRRSDVFILTEGALRDPNLRNEALALAGRARALGVPTCLNPNFRTAAWQGGATEAATVLREALTVADLAVMNREEAALIAGQDDDRAIGWLAANGPPVVVVTAGPDGVTVVDHGAVSILPACPVEVRFDIGAGDTFLAGFIAARARGMEPVEAAGWGAAAAALRISRDAGTNGWPTAAEVLSLAGAS